MKVLVTGANGYIGQGVVQELLARDCDVIAADLASDKIDKRAEISTENFFELENPFEEYGRPDVLIHLAWRDGFQHASMNHMIDLPRHYSFLKKMVESGLSQLIVMGSMHEIGFWEGCINESTPCNPQSLYGISKNALRQSIELLTKNTDVVFQWLRGYYIVGNTESGCSVFSKITQAAKEGKKKFPFTMGTNQYDFIDYDDFCKQIVEVAMQTKVTGIIECCSGYPVKLGERVEQFISDNHYDVQLEYGAFPDRPYDSKAVWGDSSKIMRIICDEK